MRWSRPALSSADCQAISDQASRLIFYSNLLYNDARARWREDARKIAPEPLAKAFFVTRELSQRERDEIARMLTGRLKIISFDAGFTAGRRAQSRPRVLRNIARTSAPAA